MRWQILLLAAGFLLPLPALAQAHGGVVTHLRVELSPRPTICAATAPAIPGGVAACVNSTQPHYHEMKELLLRAFEARAFCTFEWKLVDSMTSRARIDAVTCAAPA